MALHPWRLQGDIVKGELNPMITVFVGPERVVYNEKGDPTNDTVIDQDTSNPVQMRLSEVANGGLASDNLLRLREAAATTEAPQSKP